MKDLRNLVGINLGPQTHRADFIRVRCYCDFEPFGRASETWEEVWEIVLPQWKHHWKSTTGWRRGSTDDPISFKGKTFDSAVNKAKCFLREIKEQEKRKQDEMLQN